MTRQIFAAEINFEEVPLSVREKKIGGSGPDVKRILKELRPLVEEVYVLSTRQRFTVFIVHINFLPLTNFFHLKHGLNGFVQYYYTTEESVAHLFATASGLLSPIKGDPYIISEIEQSYRWALTCGSMGISLDTVLHKAIEIGKAVRTASGIDKFCSSIVETGIGHLYSRLENLQEKSFLIAGTGKIARLALEYLRREGITKIILAGHDFERACRLAKEFDVKVIRIEQAGDFFSHSDVLIGAAHQEVKMENAPLQTEKRLSVPGKKNRFILDFGIPPNFNPRIGEDCHADLYTLDDLKKLHASPLEAFGGLELAWSMVMSESQRYANAVCQLNHLPVLTAYLNRAFRLSGSGMKSKLKRTVRNIFLKPPGGQRPPGSTDDKSSKTLINNYRAENALEIVRHIRTLRKFKFFVPKN